MVPLSPFIARLGCHIVAVHMATNDQVNEISDGPVLSSRKAAEVNKGAIAEADLYAIGPLRVVGGHHASVEVAPPANEPLAENAPETSLGGINTDAEGLGLATAENPSEQGPEPLSYWIGLALRELCYNSVELPLGSALFGDAGLCRHSPMDGPNVDKSP